jgi:hypothetical protein
MSKTQWPKLVEGQTYRYILRAPDRQPIVRRWTVGPATSIDSANHFRQTVDRWTRRGNWKATIELVPEAPQSPVEPPEVNKTIVGALVREEDGYCYVQGLPQALRRGYDIEAMAQVGDSIVCNYGRRSYGYGWYGRVLERLSL